MAKALDLWLPARVKTILDAYGTDANYRTNSLGAYDPETGEMASIGADVDTAVQIVPPYPYDLNRDSGLGSLELGDMISGIAATELASGALSPEVNAEITIDELIGTTTETLIYKIVSVTPIRSGDSVAFYQLVLREQVGSRS